jgi:hypothetical protein
MTQLSLFMSIYFAGIDIINIFVTYLCLYQMGDANVPTHHPKLMNWTDPYSLARHPYNISTEKTTAQLYHSPN